MNHLPILNDNLVFEQLKNRKNPFFKEYFAFYSSWYGGITKNPNLMLLPVDDHMVHRGDGVFEAIKVIGRGVYLLEAHLQRLANSIDKIALQPPMSLADIKQTILATLRAANQDDALIRIFISRGPGNFSVNPYDPVQSQIYIIICQYNEYSREKSMAGVHVGQSAIPVKNSMWAQVKSCNYLPNVLMKKESLDRGLDFVIGVDSQGHVTESATENIMMIDAQGNLLYPKLANILKGTMMMRTCELAHQMDIPCLEKSFSIADLKTAREALIVGTTLNILPVVKFEDHPISNGTPGPVTKKLQQMIQQDIQSGPLRTPF